MFFNVLKLVSKEVRFFKISVKCFVIILLEGESGLEETFYQ